MAEGDGVLYNRFKSLLMEGQLDLATGGDSLKLTLHTSYTPNIDAHETWTSTGVSTTEYGSGSGYTAGGKTLGSQTVSTDDASDRGLFDAADVTWTALGPLTPATPGHAILWDDTPTSPADPLIGYWVLGTTATNGGDYTIQWSTSPSAIILLT
jgi:hypothetical protein